MTRWKSHAVATALVGWYLIMPPLDHAGRVHLHTPLSQWPIGASFDTEKECQAAVQVWRNTTKLSNGKEMTSFQRGLTQHFGCIASDDPRLKEN